MIDCVPELPALAESPAYAAIIVGLPTPVPVTVDEHEPDERAHVVGENDALPVPADCDQLTEPVGELPATVAVQLVVVPATIELEVQLIEKVVAPIVRVVDPVLPRLLESPPYVAVKVAEPAVEAVIVPEQLPAARVHVLDENVTMLVGL